MQVDLLYPNVDRQIKEYVLTETAISDLKLEYFASLICPYNVDYALMILSKIPLDVETVHYRQDILQDFIDVPQLEGLLYKSLHTVYINAKTVYAKIGSTESFFEVNENLEHIDSYIECINSCHDFYEKYFDRLKSKGMKDLISALEERYCSEEFNTLVSETQEIRTVFSEGVRSVTFGVNLDQSMRPVDVALLSVSKEPFGEKRLFEKMFSKEVRAEPISSIYKRKSKDGELIEVNKAFFTEMDALGGGYTKHFNTVLNAYYAANVKFLINIEPQINFYVGALGLITRANQMRLPICRPKIVPMEKRVFRCKDMYDMAFACKLYTGYSSLRYPAPKIHTNNCVMDEKEAIVILTGPNNGGKTTFTRAVGINQILAQCGLYVAAAEAEISIIDKILLHFPKEEEIGINTSRFTEECKEFRITIEQVTKHSMVLMNESLSSTTPTECLLIAEELMKIFADIGVRLVFTTHIKELTDKIEEINNMKLLSPLSAMTAKCDEKGKPTYEIVKGVDKNLKNARYIYERFGISFEEHLRKKQ